MMPVMMGPPSRTEHVFELTGGRLCLDFVNTVGGDRDAEPRERLAGYADLLSWARQAGAVDPAIARRLSGAAARDPAAAAAVLARALALREALFRVFHAAADGGSPTGDDLALLSGELAHALPRRRLVHRGDRYAIEWDDDPAALDAPLWRVALSASELLVSGDDLGRVRVCGLHATQECSWVFLDGTRAGTRRWCSMKDCGNKAKARRHYERTRKDG